MWDGIDPPYHPSAYEFLTDENTPGGLQPTAGMGDQETHDITMLISKLHKQQDLTLVLIEHDMRVVFHLADKIMVLGEGKVLAEGTPDEISKNETVQEAYLGKVA